MVVRKAFELMKVAGTVSPATRTRLFGVKPVPVIVISVGGLLGYDRNHAAIELHVPSRIRSPIHFRMKPDNLERVGVVLEHQLQQ
jgi:hypothetical protein